MIGPEGRISIFAYPKPCDMRKSFNTLAGLVLEIDRVITDGDAFVFVARNRKRAKVLWYDGTGLCLLAKRLDAGQFASLWATGSEAVIELSTTELSLLLEGCALVGRIPLSPAATDLSTAGRIAKASFR